MPKSVENMSIAELRREIEYIERQKRAGKVGTANVHVRLTQIEDELTKRLAINDEQRCEECGHAIKQKYPEVKGCLPNPKLWQIHWH